MVKSRESRWEDPWCDRLGIAPTGSDQAKGTETGGGRMSP